ncbi:T9SS type A sorting domain-containing protein [Candidatus Kapabacteria bacterium]|nr:T9SS type A sorting domain-containing protein [Candidatus Kapabacteria bacterium]
MKILAIFLIMLNIVNSQENWEYVPGVHNYVHKIFTPESDPNVIIIAADSIPIDLKEKDLFPSVYELLKGSGVVISRDGGSSFDEYHSLDSGLVFDIVESKQTQNLWIASLSIKNKGKFAYSYDKGKTWDLIESECNDTPKHLALQSLDDRIVSGAVSTVKGISYTFDEFLNCSNLNNLNVSVRDLDLQDGILWMAGDDNVNSGVFRSSDLGATWQEDLSGISNLRIHCVDPSGVYQKYGVVTAGTDRLIEGKYLGSGIFLSRNNGLDWTKVGANGSTVYDIEHHPKYPLFMAAACGTDGIYFSYDGGFSWERNFNLGLPADADVRVIHIPNSDVTENGYLVYAGVYNAGLFKSKNIFPELNSISNDFSSNLNDIKIYPIPAIDFINILFESKKSEKLDLKIYSQDGVLVLQKEINANIGINNISLDLPSNLSNGIYHVVITGSEQKSYEKLVINRKL